MADAFSGFGTGWSFGPGWFQESEPISSRAESYKSPGDNSSPSGRTIPAGIGTSSYDGQIVWWNGFKVIGGTVTASFVMFFMECVFANSFSLIQLLADEQIIVSSQVQAGQNVRYYDGTQTTPDPLLTSILGATDATSWPRGCYVVFEDFDCTNYGNRIPLIRAVLSGSASASASTAEESTQVFGTISYDDTGDNFSVTVDPYRRLAYQFVYLYSPTAAGNSQLVSVVDLLSNTEISRVEVAGAYLGAALNNVVHWPVALPGSDFVVGSTTQSTPSTEGFRLTLLNVLTGEIVDRLDTSLDIYGAANSQIGIEVTVASVALLSTGAATKYLVFCRDAEGYTSGTKSNLMVALADVTNGTLTWLVHAGTTELGNGQARMRSLAIGHITDGTATIYWTETDKDSSSTYLASVRTAQINASGVVSDSVAYLETEVGKYPVAVAFDSTDDGLVVFREDGTTKKINADGSTEYVVTSTADNVNLGKQASFSSVEYAVHPGFVVGYGSGFDVYLIDLSDGSATKIFEADDSASDSLDWERDYYYDQFTGALVEQSGNTGRIIKHSAGDLTPDHVDLVDMFVQLATWDGRFSVGDLDFSGFPGDETSGLKLENDTTIDNLEQSIASTFDVSIVESDGIRKYRYPQRDGSLAVDTTIAFAEFIDLEGQTISKDIASGEEELAACTVSYFDIDGGYKKLEQTYARPVGVFDVTRSKKRRTVNTILSLSAVQALRLATMAVFRSVVGSETYTFGLMPAKADVEPGDLIQFTFRGFTVIARMVEATLQADYSQSQCRAEQYLAVSEATIAAATSAAAADTSLATATRLIYLDVPLLAASHDRGGTALVQYGQIAGYGAAEISGLLYRSADAIAFTAVGLRTSITPVVGTIRDISGTPADPFSTDAVNTITVRVTSGDSADLVTISATAFAAGVNLAAIGAPGRWVLIWFETVTADDADRVLSNLMWGVRGSEVFIDDLVAGDTFVLLRSTDYIRFSNAVTALDDTFYYKAAHPLVALGVVPTLTYAATGVAETPYAPRNLDAEFSDNDIRLSWDYRSRVAAGLNPTNYGEASLSFAVDILFETGGLVRTLTVSTNEAIYTEAQYTADFGALPAEFEWTVQMISAVVGRGYAAQATTTINVGAILLAGDEQGGTDQLALAGDMQSGSDAEAFREITTT